MLAGGRSLPAGDPHQFAALTESRGDVQSSVLSVAERLKIVPQIGRVEWIGVRPERGTPLRELDEALAIAGHGLAGDRHLGGGDRQVTLLQAEHLPVIAALVGRAEVPPQLVRRNLVISGINLLSLKDLRFAIGDAILVGTKPCAPCQKMEDALGPGGFQAMRGHGGICARIERGGVVRLGARVRVV
jgi:MOSC domain-containing protein YiiM